MDVVSGSYPGEIYFFRRKPNSTYAAPAALKSADGQPIKVGYASAVAVGDWDGDGNPDLIVGNIDGAVFLIRNEGTRGKLVFDRPQPLKAKGEPISAGRRAGPCVADWDGDGKPDLLLGSETGSVVWYRNTGTKAKPELAAPVTLVKSLGPQERGTAAFDKPTRSGSRPKVAVADWNGDGRPDLLVGDFVSGGSGKYHGWVWVYLRKAPDLAGSPGK